MNDRKVDDQALQDYMTFQYVPDPNTMSPDIKRLRPGHYFTKKARITNAD
ncbi:hypothetical protein [Paucilactobacillus hokkaidonensis]